MPSARSGRRRSAVGSSRGRFGLRLQDWRSHPPWLPWLDLCGHRRVRPPGAAFLFLFVLPQRLGVQIVEPELDFLFARLAPIGQQVHLLDARAIVRLAGHPLGQFLGFHLHEIAVHQEQPLQRHGGGEALLGADIRRREIEQLQILVQLVAAHLAVHRAPRERRRQLRRGPPSALSRLPATNSTESRICSASMRLRSTRQ